MVVKMRTGIYQLGEIYIELHIPEEMQIPENLEKFAVDSLPEDQTLQRTYFIEYTDEIVQVERALKAQKIPGKEALRENLQVFQTERGECRSINLHGVPQAYAVSLLKLDGTSQVWVDRRYDSWMQYDTVFVAMLALEKEMIQVDAMLLHSAYMCYDGTAVLFSAASGTGKSTQADLWEKYRGTRTINGDRSLLIRETDGWKAYGWPICGSSEICHNEKYPIRAIVMLKQAKENKVYPLQGFRAVRDIMEQITINAWDSEFQIRVMDLLEELRKEVPIYCLECDISEDAVRCLEQVL